MARGRQEQILQEINNAIVPTDVCATVENLGKIISTYKNEVNEEKVVQCLLTSVFRKYANLRDTAKELRQKVAGEKVNHESSSKKMKERILNLEKDFESLKSKNQRDRKASDDKIKLMEEELKARRLLDNAETDKNGEKWLSTKRIQPQTSTQKPSKMRKHEVVEVPESSDEEAESDDFYLRDTCADISPIKFK